MTQSCRTPVIGLRRTFQAHPRCAERITDMPNRFYDQGTRPRVFINWQSFESWGLPSSWKGPFTDAVINAYTRWMQVAGVDLRFQFWNYTTNTTANPGELLIQ